MVSREQKSDFGADAFSAAVGNHEVEYVPGSQWGLPASGSGSVVAYPIRMLGMMIDWALAVGISYLFFNYDPLANLLIFAGLIFLGTLLFGASPAQMLLGLKIIPVSGRSTIVVRALIRTLVMLLILGSVVLSKDRQPLHDLLAGTAVVRR